MAFLKKDVDRLFFAANRAVATPSLQSTPQATPETAMNRREKFVQNKFGNFGRFANVSPEAVGNLQKAFSARLSQIERAKKTPGRGIFQQG